MALASSLRSASFLLLLVSLLLACCPRLVLADVTQSGTLSTRERYVVLDTQTFEPSVNSPSVRGSVRFTIVEDPAAIPYDQELYVNFLLLQNDTTQPTGTCEQRVSAASQLFLVANLRDLNHTYQYAILSTARRQWQVV